MAENTLVGMVLYIEEHDQVSLCMAGTQPDLTVYTITMEVLGLTVVNGWNTAGSPH